MIRRMTCAFALLLAACGGSDAPDGLPTLQTVATDSLGIYNLTTPSDGRHAAWWESNGETFDLWVADEAMAAPRRLDVSSRYSRGVVWSVDGRRLAATATDSTGTVLMIVTVANGAAQRIPIGPEFIPIAWFRDGQRVLYARLLEGGLFRSEVMDLATHESTPILPDGAPAHFATVSPANDAIIVNLTQGGRTTLARLDSIGAPLVPLTTDGFERIDDNAAAPPWSPDGTRLLFSSDRTGRTDIWVLDATTWTVRQLTDDIQVDRLAAWSPDGRFVAYTSERGRQPDIWVVPAEGGASVRVTNTPEYEWAVAWRADGRGLLIQTDLSRASLHTHDIASSTDRPILPDSLNLVDFRTSPDGRQVIAVTGQIGSLRHLYLVNTDGSGLRRVWTGLALWNQVRWSPDGRSVLVTALDGGSPDPWLVDVATGAARRLVDWPGQDGEGDFTSDGSAALIVSDRESRLGDVWRVPLDSAPPERITQTGNIDNVLRIEGDRILVTLFGGPGGRFVLGEVGRDGTVRTLWDRSSVYGVALDQVGMGDSVIVMSNDDSRLGRTDVVSLTTGGARRLGEPGDRASAMARVGRWVVFNTSDARGARLGVVHLDSGVRRLLTDGSASAFGPEFFADSTGIAYGRAIRHRQIATADISALLGGTK